MDARQSILQAATRLFAARGFDATSLQAIADEVGIRKQSLLYHYPTKNKLRLAVLESVLERWNEVLPRLLMAAAGGEPRFSVVIEETVTFFVDDPDRARLLMREILDRPDDMKARITEHVQPWVTVVSDYIRKGQEYGEVHAEVDPEAYILQVINMVVSGIATSTSLAGALLPDADPARARERHQQELTRIARYALFTAPLQEAEMPPRSDAAALRREGREENA